MESVEQVARDIDQGMERFQNGRAVVLVNDGVQPGTGMLVFAAEYATVELLAFTVRHSSGFVCVALPTERADDLQLPAQPHDDGPSDALSASFAVTVDAVQGTTTGISAADRARTIRTLADPASGTKDFTRPGHVVPLRARPAGMQERVGLAEAAIELAQLAGLQLAAGLAEIVSADDPIEMAGGDELRAFAERHGLSLLTISDVYGRFLRRWHRVERGHPATMTISGAAFSAVDYRQPSTGASHLAFLRGELRDGATVSVHPECLPGMILRESDCDCAELFAAALGAAAAEPSGAVLYLRIGGRRCPRSNRRGAAPDTSDRSRLQSWLAAGILRDQNLHEVHLRDGSASDVAALAEFGIAVVPGPAPRPLIGTG
jgi:3,4-dihydroxy 2-butanone 4-phosphate synthase/GTP cyclohydrolase II